MRKRLFAFVQKKFNLYVDDGEVNEVKGVNLNMCEGTKFNLLDEDMPVVVMPEDMNLSTDTQEKQAHAQSKGVSFAEDTCGGEGMDQNGEAVRGKWNEIDLALGLASPTSDGGGRMEGQEDYEQYFHRSDSLPPAPEAGASQNANPNASEGNEVKSNLELQASMFSWRYPLLFDAMSSNNSASSKNSTVSSSCGQEDLTMTAMRIIETSRDAQDSDSEASSKPDPLRVEALRFVRDEVSLW